MSERIIDGVLMAGYDGKSVNEIKSQLITVDEMTILEKKTWDYSSRYVIMSILTELQNIPEKLAVVGTACQIQALKPGVRQT